MSTYNLCFEQEFEKYNIFLSENFPFFVVKFSMYLNRCVFVMSILNGVYKPLYIMEQVVYSACP